MKQHRTVCPSRTLLITIRVAAGESLTGWLCRSVCRSRSGLCIEALPTLSRWLNSVTLTEAPCRDTFVKACFRWSGMPSHRPEDSANPATSTTTGCRFVLVTNRKTKKSCWLNIAEGHDDCFGAFAVRTFFKLNISTGLAASLCHSAYVMSIVNLQVFSSIQAQCCTAAGVLD